MRRVSYGFDIMASCGGIVQCGRYSEGDARERPEGGAGRYLGEDQVGVGGRVAVESVLALESLLQGGRCERWVGWGGGWLDGVR